MLLSTDLRPGHFIEKDGILWEVISYHHNKTGRGSAIIKVKLKNLLEGGTIEHTFRSGEKIKEADVQKKKAQYQYNDKDNFYFMDLETFDQIIINKTLIEDKIKFLKENIEVEIGFYNNSPFTLFLPNSVEYKVIYCEPGLKGDSVTSNTKPATIETGYELQVPIFIQQGEYIKIDTRTGKYIERSKK